MKIAGFIALIGEWAFVGAIVIYFYIRKAYRRAIR